MADIAWGSITAWALDFLRAFHERPMIVQKIVLFLIGKYARNELKGLIECLETNGMDTHFSYDLEEMDYNK